MGNTQTVVDRIEKCRTMRFDRRRCFKKLTVVKSQKRQIQQLPMFSVADVENQLVVKLILHYIPGCFRCRGTTCTCQLVSYDVDMAVGARMA